MLEVVINKCYGGFGLSEKAEKFFNNLKNWSNETNEEDENVETDENIETDDNVETDENSCDFEQTKSRTDPDLIATVKKFGDEANNTFSKLKIETFPDCVKKEWLTIHEYDGMESVFVDWNKAIFLTFQTHIHKPDHFIVNEMKKVLALKDLLKYSKDCSD